MKKITSLAMLLVLVLVLSVSASALQVTTATIGNEDQDRVNDVSTSVTVTNDGTADLTGINMQFIGDSRYNIRFDPATFDLKTNEQQIVTVKGDIPVSFDAVVKHSSNSDFLDETPFKIGTIKAYKDSTDATADLNMQAVNQLKIKKVTAVCGDKSERLKDGEEFEELSPDTQCSITIEFENTFNDDDRDDLRIGDVEIDPLYIEVESTDSDLDLDEDDDTSLDADDKDEMTFEFDIEEDVDEGKYPVEIRVYGIDENDAYHGEMWTVKFEVERMKHDLQIKSASISPVEIDNCRNQRINIDANILNLGKRDEEEVVVQAIIPDLDIEKKISNIELDEDESERVSFSLNIPEGTESRVYSVELNTFFDTTALSNTKRFDFVVNKCTETTEEETSTDTVETVTVEETTSANVAETTTAATARIRGPGSTFKDSPAYIWLLAGISVLLAVIVIVLLIVLFRRPFDEE